LFDAEIRARKNERAEALIDLNKAYAGGKDAEQHLKTLTT